MSCYKGYKLGPMVYLLYLLWGCHSGGAEMCLREKNELLSLIKKNDFNLYEALVRRGDPNETQTILRKSPIKNVVYSFFSTDDKKKIAEQLVEEYWKSPGKSRGLNIAGKCSVKSCPLYGVEVWFPKKYGEFKADVFVYNTCQSCNQDLLCTDLTKIRIGHANYSIEYRYHLPRGKHIKRSYKNVIWASEDQFLQERQLMCVDIKVENLDKS